MRLQTAFYFVGVIFLFFTVWYFAREFLKEIPNIVKILILGLCIILAFVAGDILREKNK